MVEFKLAISQDDGKAFKMGLSGKEADSLIGKKLGETIQGDEIGLAGYELKLTGGSDDDGFPMRAGYHGSKVSQILLTDGPGFNRKFKGDRRKKRIRGDTITDMIAQLNFKVLKAGKDKLETLLAEEQNVVEKSRDEINEEKKAEIADALKKEAGIDTDDKAEKKKEDKPAEKKKEDKPKAEEKSEKKKEDAKAEEKPAEEGG
ncbi:30S ribosomal protein S6e [Candidatus Undinarchaeota archaeon]